MHLQWRWGLVAPLNTSFHVQPVPPVESQPSDGSKDGQSNAVCASDGQAWQARLPDHILELIFDKLLLPGSRQCPAFMEQVTGLHLGMQYMADRDGDAIVIPHRAPTDWVACWYCMLQWAAFGDDLGVSRLQ